MATAKLGSKWTNKIYYYPAAGELLKKVFNAELVDHTTQLTDADEDILEVSVYEVDITKWQLTKLILYHTFLLLQTKQYYWSIEKNSKGITIQRSKDKNAVKNMFRQEFRPQWEDLKHVEKDAGNKTIKQVIEMLYRENELNKKYNYLFSNCKHFAQTVYDFTAKTEEMYLWQIGRAGRLISGFFRK